jgi:hypothetical protein
LETRLRAEIGPAVWLAAGDIDRVAPEIASALAMLSTDGFSLQHFWGAYWTVFAALRRGDVEAAARGAEQLKRGMAGSLLGRVQFVRVHGAYACACAALASGGGAGATTAAREARRIEREGVAWAAGFAQCIRAAIEQSRAPSLLEDASRAFTTAQMKIFAAVADRRRGELVGGAEGASLTQNADAALVAQGVTAPADYAAMLLPAFP